jgi:hypothetical protein
MGDYIIRDWHNEALCQRHPDPDMWHYENSMFQDEQQLEVLRSIQAIEVCHDCPVRTQCLAQGMEDENIVYNGGSGSIWGGLLNSERYTLKTRRVGSRRLESEERHRNAVRKRIGRLKV